MSTPSSFYLEPASANRRPSPYPPSLLKRQIYNEPSVFKAIDDHSIKEARTNYRNFKDLMWNLIYKKHWNELEKARAIFRWMTTKNMYTIMFDSESPGSPEQIIGGFKDGKSTAAKIFECLANFAGLHCVALSGWAKGIEYKPGMPVTGLPPNHSWNAVFIDGNWQLVDSLWATQNLQSEHNTPENLVVEYDDFYFLTEPSMLIYSHCPEEPAWQLLHPARARKEYEDSPLAQSFFFSTGMQFLQQNKGIVFTNSGILTLTLGFTRPTAFNFELSYGDNNTENLQGIQLKRYVIQETTENRVTFYFRSPREGSYYITMFVQPVAEPAKVENVFKMACQYKIICDQAPSAIQPFPQCSNANWGAGAPVRQHGLTASQNTALLAAPNARAEVSFIRTRYIRLIARLIKDGMDEETLENAVKVKEQDSQIFVTVQLPLAGEYGLEVYANTPLHESDTYTHMCQYLVSFTDRNFATIYGQVYDRTDLEYGMQATVPQLYNSRGNFATLGAGQKHMSPGGQGGPGGQLGPGEQYAPGVLTDSRSSDYADFFRYDRTFRVMSKIGDEELLEHPGGMLKAKGAVRAKLVLNDLVPYNNLQMLDEEPIGSGAVGVVYRAVHKDWGCHVAYKKLDVRFITAVSQKKDLKNEAEIHHLLRHAHIVSLLGIVFEPNNYGLVLEHLPYGSLEEFLTNIKDKTGRSFCVPWKLKLKMAYDVCRGMSYLHTLQSPIIHGDLKIQNLLIGEHLIVKISDFGLSKWKDFERSHTKVGAVCGTPSHVPPEHWLNADLRPNEKFDIYSFGIALWEMLTEDHAYAGCRDRIRELVIGNTRPSLHKLPPDLPSVISAVSDNCWHQEPIKRPTFSELLPRLRDFTPSQHESDKVVREVLTIYHKQDKVSEHGHKMDRVRMKLSDAIRRTDRILTHLLTKRAVTSQEFEEISSQSVIYSRTRCLLDVLRVKPVTAYWCFLDALTVTDQQHLHRLLETDENINLDHMTTLIDNYEFLKNNIVVNDTRILDHLKQTGVLDKQEVEEIQAEKTECQRSERLLHYIQRTSQDQYQIFLEALQNSKQEFIAEVLETNPNSRASTKAALHDIVATKNKSPSESVLRSASTSKEISTSKETSRPIPKIS